MGKKAKPDAADIYAIAKDILGNCVAGRTLQVARIVSARYDAALSRHGLTAHQLTLLSMITKMQPVAARDMLPYLKMEQSTLSRNLDRMEARGWIEVGADKADSRSKRVSLTSDGTRTLRAAHEDWRKAQQWARREFGDEGFDGLRALAHAINPLLPR